MEVLARESGILIGEGHYNYVKGENWRVVQTGCLRN